MTKSLLLFSVLLDVIRWKQSRGVSQSNPFRFIQRTKEIENENQNVYGRFYSALVNGYADERDDQHTGFGASNKT
jgi:hypothetical protein